VGLCRAEFTATALLIDPHWYGEIPRTYFFDKAHSRVGISGLITEKEYLKMIDGISEKKYQ
jgi:hypothetical protein